MDQKIRLDDKQVVAKYGLDRVECRLDAARLDAATTLFFARQLEEIDQQLYDVKYGALEYAELLAMKQGIQPGAESYTYRQYNGTGQAKVTANYSGSSPRSDVEGLEFNSRIVGIRTSFGYNFQELKAAAASGTPLEMMRAEKARRALQEKINAIMLQGDTEFGLTGLFGASDVGDITSAGSFTVPTTGTGTSKLWSTKTAALILDDMFGIVDQIPTNTQEREQPKRLLLPYARLRTISRMKIDSVSPITVLQFFKENRPQVEVRGALMLDTAGLISAAAAARMVAYDPSRENIEGILPVPMETLAPQLNGMEYVVELHARIGGVVCRYPLSVCYGDGI
jgi:hypothetical protein